MRTAILVIFFFFFVAAALTVVDARSLERVVFVHRHGARTPSFDVDGECGKIGCFDLTVPGQKMLENLGETFARRYGAAIFGNSTTVPDRDAYDFRKVHMCSDTDSRTIQSSGAFFFGLFGKNTGTTSIGAPHLQVLTTDCAPLISAHAVNPALAFHDRTLGGNATKWAMDQIMNVQKIMDLATIQKIGAEIGIACGMAEIESSWCPMFAASFIRLMIPAGKAKQFPFTMSRLDELTKLRIFVEYAQHFTYYDNTNTDFFAKAGYAQLPLLDAILADGANGDLRLSEYSGHDSSLLALYTTMGNKTFVYPRVGSALTFEFYSDKTVKTMLYVPQQTPESNFQILDTEYVMVCIDATGKTYTASSCPVADLKRFAASRAGSEGGAKAGSCYVYPADLKAQNCEPTSTGLPNVLCAEYRSGCPFDACGVGFHLVKNLTCVKN